MNREDHCSSFFCAKNHCQQRSHDWATYVYTYTQSHTNASPALSSRRVIQFSPFFPSPPHPLRFSTSEHHAAGGFCTSRATSRYTIYYCCTYTCGLRTTRSRVALVSFFSSFSPSSSYSACSLSSALGARSSKRQRRRRHPIARRLTTLSLPRRKSTFVTANEIMKEREKSRPPRRPSRFPVRVPTPPPPPSLLVSFFLSFILLFSRVREKSRKQSRHLIIKTIDRRMGIKEYRKVFPMCSGRLSVGFRLSSIICGLYTRSEAHSSRANI